MSAKQEAQRIFERFYNETLSHLSDHITREDAIQSALICVDEMIKILNKLYTNPWVTDTSEEEINIKLIFLENVKQEIKNLRK